MRVFDVPPAHRLSGTLDYLGEKESATKGREVGQQAVADAEKWFCQGGDDEEKDHPIMAMCLTAVGYNTKTLAQKERSDGNEDLAVR